MQEQQLEDDKFTPEQLQQINNCKAALQEALDTHSCQLHVAMLVAADGVVPQVRVLPRPQEEANVGG